ncbi:hypothetical protein M407DRAFT_28905 [Tulasnella calospora MUT 4182]|uniref:Uncharacterized protein n=1 Tax=Tulasnella calospora MUT 4182 TaxID=1051891 RepID=A0A0C3KJ75_9AGAM|nr:hypothetical protein M407DRAFT_28905 [Tulasnella calospora MUT 4182]
MTQTLDKATYDRLADERITKTNIGAFDQLTVISQRAINGQLAHMWKNPNSILRKIEVRPMPKAPEYYFTADLDPPTVKLLTGPNKQQVVFYINIKSGKVGYYDGVGPAAVPKTTDLGVSRLALRVNLAFDQLDANGVPKNIQDTLKKVDDYSVKQLIFDFTTADLIPVVNGVDKNESKFDISKEAEASFYQLLENYLDVLRKKDPSGNVADHNILHYVATAKESKLYTPAPTCAPTDLNFQSLPFVIEDKDRMGETGVLEGKNNMLVYLQMTNDRKMPNALLEPTANWVMPPFDETSETYDGTVCLSKATFLEGLLLPRLEHLNSESTWVVDEAWWKARDAGFTNEYQVYGHLGLTAKDKENDHFKDCGWKLVSQENGTRKYEYKNTHRIDDDHGLWRVYQEGRTTNTITIPEGLDSSSKSKIDVEGSTAVETYMHLDGMGEIGKTKCTVKCTWVASLILDGVDEGALKVTVNNPKTTMSLEDDKSFRYPDILDPTKESVTKMFNDSGLHDIKADLEALFSGSWSFVFSQGRDFFIDKAGFNREGDLLGQLKYKSVGV